MNFTTKFVGLDVSKDEVATAVADWETGSTRYHGVSLNALDTIHKVLKCLGKPEELYVCYEAGVTGYGLARFLTGLGIKFMVVVPSKIPQAPGPKVKTDRRDAIMLADKLKAGELVSVWAPSEAYEALRDLVRARKARVENCTRAKQRVSMFLLRHEITRPAEMKPWGDLDRAWLRSSEFSQKNTQATLWEYIIAVEEAEQSIRRLEQIIHERRPKTARAPLG